MRAVLFLVVSGATLACVSGSSAEARTHREGGGVPFLDVRQSCRDSQKFSGSDGNDATFKGCMQDENGAKDQLSKRWSSFKPRDKQDCVEQGRAPSPSYVEVLTCLEMSTGAIKSAPKLDGRAVPQIGGPVAPGLSTGGH